MLFTIIGGVAAFIVGQIFVKFVLEPVHNYRKTVAKISHALIEHANVIANPGVPPVEVMRQVSHNLRNLAAELQSHLYSIPLYDTVAKVFRLPPREHILAATDQLVGLSNSIYTASEGIYKANANRCEAICDTLGIYMRDGDRWPAEA